MKGTKSLPITKRMVWEAYKRVKKNSGGAGVDFVKLEDFELKLSNNLYKIWNRLSSGSYFPPPVKEVEIPKKDGKVRKLGIPTIEDRIAQTVVKDYLEERFEKEFHPNSFGYRPNKSAHGALEVVRRLTRNNDWIVDLDISKFFDNLDHELLMLALRKHVSEEWVLMYVKRWLEAPVSTCNEGLKYKNGLGTPQGGVISPLLANLYLHYAFDKWITIKFPAISFVRYADDIIIHCKSLEQANVVLEAVKERLNDCKLSAHPDKTKIVYCKDSKRRGKYPVVSFDFLGYTFKPRKSKSKYRNNYDTLFDLAISKDSCKRILAELRDSRFHLWSRASIEEIAGYFNPKIRGWIHYYGKFRKSNLYIIFKTFHLRLAKWAVGKYKLKFYVNAFKLLKRICKTKPNLFAHWTAGFRSI